MTRDANAVDYHDLARELDAAREAVGGDPEQLAGHVERARTVLTRITTPATRPRPTSRDDVLAALHAARRAAERQRALVSALEEERAQLLRELGDINDRSQAVARYRAISPATPRDGLDFIG
ncbi:MAG: hypothetical protein HYX65_03615 [Gemmatimonadetes bacterium]|nr:hypothetical protein [Gemmatimonadota bacterium]